MTGLAYIELVLVGCGYISSPNELLVANSISTGRNWGVSRSSTSFNLYDPPGYRLSMPSFI